MESMNLLMEKQQRLLESEPAILYFAAIMHVACLHPFAPFVSAELWADLKDMRHALENAEGLSSVLNFAEDDLRQVSWPNTQALTDLLTASASKLKYNVFIDGKSRGALELEKSLLEKSDEDILTFFAAHPKLKKFLDGKMKLKLLRSPPEKKAKFLNILTQ
eukprot:TRINITY_DN2772_c0_g3_i2.p4 TRINITY_DN2772_c0_g3~~TRINITY_DN2772_c0_g3_i2.p4  ORF type:complete len:162 (+),score=43.43 TRINITY_DN2772_c0_g3_i2:673-1158(+)